MAIVSCSTFGSNLPSTRCETCRYAVRRGRQCLDRFNYVTEEPTVAQQLEDTPRPRRTDAAIAARKRKAAERRESSGMLVMVSTEPGGSVFERRKDLTMDKFVALKAAGHQVFVATAWQEW